jgi:hypothetical protein
MKKINYSTEEYKNRSELEDKLNILYQTKQPFFFDISLK